MTWKMPVLNFKKIGSYLTGKSTKSMHYRITKINVAQGIIFVDLWHRYSNEVERANWDIYDDFKFKNPRFSFLVYMKIFQRF